MEKFTTLTGIAAPLAMENVDTDMIIPKQFLKTIKRTGLGAGLFYEHRFDEQGEEIADFVLNCALYNRAKILVTGGISAVARRASTPPGRCWISASAVLSRPLSLISSTTTVSRTASCPLPCPGRTWTGLWRAPHAGPTPR